MLIRSGWGDELLPVSGHLGNSEPIVKPTSTEDRSRFSFYGSQRKGGNRFGEQKRQNKFMNPDNRR